MSRRGCRKSAGAPAQPRRYRYVRSFSNRIILLLSSIMVAASLLTILLYWLLYPILPSEMYAPILAVALSLAFCLLAGCLLSVILSKKIYRPFEQLIRATEKIAQGDFKVRLAETADPGSDLGALQRSFNHMASELDSTEIFRNDFINNFSHEFKTPIVSIRGFARLLQEGNLTAEQHDKYVNIIAAESDRLANMATNILLLSKLENQKIVTDRTRFYLDEQLRHAILTLEKQWSSRNIELDIDLDEVMYEFNEDMLLQVWLNLFGNAFKFTPDGGTVFCTLRQEKNEAVVRIRDTGCGMSDAVITRIFEKFYQGGYLPQFRRERDRTDNRRTDSGSLRRTDTGRKQSRSGQYLYGAPAHDRVAAFRQSKERSRLGEAGERAEAGQPCPGIRGVVHCIGCIYRTDGTGHMADVALHG